MATAGSRAEFALSWAEAIDANVNNNIISPAKALMVRYLDFMIAPCLFRLVSQRSIFENISVKPYLRVN